MKVHAREALFVPRKALSGGVLEALKERYTHHFYEQRACANCEHLPDRPSSMCYECPAMLGTVALCSPFKLNGVEYVKLPLGDADNITKFLERKGLAPQVVKHHPRIENTRLGRPIRFIGKYRKGQEEIVRIAAARKRGVIVAPPRSGKTVIATALTCMLGRKTFIVASQREWLLGFRETFIGSRTQEALTDLHPSRIGFCQKVSDFDRYDVCLLTFQTFLYENGRALLAKIRSLAGLIIIDEVHKTAANEFLRVAAQMNCDRIIGLTGTPDRKDGRYRLVDHVLGHVIAVMKTEVLRPEIHLVKTQYSKEYKRWDAIVTHLECDPARLKLIAEWAVKDVAAGHMVLIPMLRVKAIIALAMAINRIAGAEIARPFHGKLRKDERDRYLHDARQYKCKVLVGTANLLGTGTNIPRASMLHEVMLSSNLPQCQQRTSRVLTPYGNKKPRPGIRYFLDNIQVRKSCLRNEYYQCVMPRFKPIVSDKVKIVMNQYLSKRSSREENAYGWT